MLMIGEIGGVGNYKNTKPIPKSPQPFHLKNHALFEVICFFSTRLNQWT